MPEAGKDALLFRLFNEIGIIEQLARARFERSLPDGLKLSHFTVLNHFVRLGGERSPAELARAFQVTKGAMTNTLQRLEARGLVEISPDPHDGRAKRVRITPAGERTRAAAVAAVAPGFADLEKQISQEDIAAALPFLERIRSHLDRARDKER